MAQLNLSQFIVSDLIDCLIIRPCRDKLETVVSILHELIFTTLFVFNLSETVTYIPPLASCGKRIFALWPGEPFGKSVSAITRITRVTLAKTSNRALHPSALHGVATYGGFIFSPR